ncbi:MAG: hypothetical protein IJD41_03455 [Alphaproteobacteria bacterium]|nr:hypothetical protein [Alphaproteobacteria bacterium]MBQ7127358.1 hypothetical protein [Alphaproteobacteria bacterium]
MAKAPKAVSRLNMCKAFIHKAFHEVWFQDKELKTLMHDCYLDNIDDMMSFAMENEINLHDYFMQIKQELLTIPNTYERQR